MGQPYITTPSAVGALSGVSDSIPRDPTMRRIIDPRLCVIALKLTWLPVLADAALCKCVDLGTKADSFR
jgi:hypothetical protein